MYKIKNIYSPIFVIFILAVFLRIIFLTTFPFRVDGDASRFGLDGLLAWNEHQQLFAVGWYGHTNVYFYIVGFFEKIFSNNLLGLRMLSAFGGILGILTTYLCAKELFNKKVAAWAAFFLAISPFDLVFSRVGTEVIWMIFFAPIVIFFLLKKNPYYLFFSGIFLGISQYFYPGARLIPILILILLFLLFAHKQRNFKHLLLSSTLILFGFLLVYAPMIGYFLDHKEAYFARINIVGIFQSGWLKNEMETRSLVDIFTHQIVNSYLAFHMPVKVGFAWFYRSPFLDYLHTVLFTIGLFVSIFRIKKWQYQFLYMYLIVGIFFGGVLTIDSPASSRYVILFPAVAMFIGLGINYLINLFSKKSLMQKMVICFFALILFVTSLYSYYVHETVDTWNYDVNTQIATYAGRYLGAKSSMYTIYFIGNSYMYYNAVPALPFLTKKPGVDIFLPLDESKMTFEKGSAFIILPSRQNELLKLQKQYINGKTVEFRNPKGALLAFIFEI